ncbi:putative solute carrier family 35 member C320,08 OS=Schizosaccharomyces pombe (strain 972 / ATCC 24843) GN=SPCC320.08 PE=1 SV=1 [Rhizoctonia solani AG-1 IB]|uniref:Putative solute carrier family 35 member C320,08 n=1 Tax=Thanatephorus cucumeris (strain AG1-IB / isolate 7/3/14) TaxID=1108050 RepID=A0A0B7G095_THACB|nr:putative solute carrier family 35 member C320,08 OS=Schizosaccharomyces pombe (strain 972 / ATCC 24843) GN=SPCC320.08 PE=1 SV=1 [Rhizoctonia solani AG-1 IB]
MNTQEPIQPELVRSNSTASSVKSGKLSHHDASVEAQQAEVEHKKVRPLLDYSSFGNFWASVGARTRSIFTRRFVLALLGGQLVSICITCTSVSTTELVNRGWSLPTTQTFFLYFALFVLYTPYTIYQYGFKGWGNVVIKDGWKYFILAACDVEANFLVVNAYKYTNLLSCMLLNSWAIPTCAFFAWLYMRPKYHWTQLIGILICIGGMGMLIASDHLTGTGQYPAASMVKGDLFMLAGATLYGFTNATEEFFVRNRPLYEVIGQLGMYGMIINAIQASGLEHDGMRTANWNGGVIGLLFAYTIAMLILYTTAPLIYRAASSVYYNLSLLSSNFYGLLFALGLYHQRPYWLYFVAFVVIIFGLVSYFWHSTPEEQGKLDPQKPEYVQRTPERDASPQVPV